MTIQVLGSGCPTCAKLNHMIQNIVNDMGWQTNVEYITGQEGIKKIIALGAMSSPLLVVNGKLAMTGFISDKEKVKTKIQACMQE